MLVDKTLINLIPMFLLIGCVSVDNQFIALENNEKYLLYVSNRYRQTDDLLIEIIYENKDSVPHCIDYSDGEISNKSRGIRVFEGEQLLEPYQSEISQVYDIEPYYLPLAIKIIRPGEKFGANFILYNDYYFDDEKSYTLRYTLPVTYCEAILDNPINMPSSTSVRFFGKNNPTKISWVEGLEVIKEASPKWAQNGFFAEMTPHKVIFDIRDGND